MLNIKNVSITNDGEFRRISVSWDELNDEGKTISVNNRISRIITDAINPEVSEAIGTINNYVNDIISSQNSD